MAQNLTGGSVFIDDLIPTLPDGGLDRGYSIDNELRGLKYVLLNTLPNTDGAITATQAELNILDGAIISTTELNYLDGATANIQGQLNTSAVNVTNNTTAIATNAAAIAAHTTGTYVNEVNGIPGIEGALASLNIVTNITQSTDTLIGPTGSGATYIWTALDGIPTDTDWIMVKISVSGYGLGLGSNLVQLRIVATGSLTFSLTLTGNTYGIGFYHGYPNSAGSLAVGGVTNAYIPLATGRRFRLMWSSGFTVNDVTLIIIGYGKN